MSNNPRCLYDNSFSAFLHETEMSVLGMLCDNYHGDARTTTRDAWKTEISIMRETLSQCGNKNGRIIFEYDIPRLGKRIDVVLLHRGKLPKKLTVPFWYEWEAPQTVRARKLSCNAPRTDSDRGMIIRWVD